MHIKSKNIQNEPLYYSWVTIGFIVFGGLLWVILMMLYAYTTRPSIYTFLSSLGFGFLLSGACFCLGGLMGFIFGIPSFIQNVPNTQQDSYLKYNDNLIEISDWLTKIIIGVGLVELKNIPEFLLQIGRQLGTTLFGTWGTNVVIVIVVYFTCAGFLSIYFWTRTDFTLILKNMDNKISRKTLSSDLTKANLLNDANVQIDSNSNTATAMGINAEDTSNFRAKAINESNKRPIIQQDDLQKGRWGGKNENDGKILTCNVTPYPQINGFYNLEIQVYSIKDIPLQGEVAIFVHDTFNIANNVIFVSPVDGIAKVTLVGYEAFTIGALCEDGMTDLELDLNKQTGYPKNFYWH